MVFNQKDRFKMCVWISQYAMHNNAYKVYGNCLRNGGFEVRVPPRFDGVEILFS
jgi:methylmalonyl-CoA mutase cobalamin-binding subunit